MPAVRPQRFVKNGSRTVTLGRVAEAFVLFVADPGFAAVSFRDEGQAERQMPPLLAQSGGCWVFFSKLDFANPSNWSGSSRIVTLVNLPVKGNGH